jgi:CHAD domain-containing protein
MRTIHVPLQIAFDRRLRALNAGLAVRLDHDAEALHQARVASRRLRAALPLLEPHVQDSTRDRRAFAVAGKEIRRLTEALGRVRELDVALMVIDEVAAWRPDLTTGTDAIRAAIARDRFAHLVALRDRVSVGRLRKVSRFLADAAKRSADTTTARPRATGVRHLADGLSRTIEHAGVLYAVDRLHNVRIAVKKLRYALELEAELGRPSIDKWLPAIKQVQEILGRVHDLEVVVGYANAIAGGPDTAGEVRSAVCLILEVLEHETHERHASYLDSRDVLRRIIHVACHLGQSRQSKPLPARARRPAMAAARSVERMKRS